MKMKGYLPWLLIGILSGLGIYTFAFAEGASYLSNDPKACANCHIMQSYYDGWNKSNHHNVATCNDCHTPHNIVAKYAVKAENGLFHSYAFTTGWFHDPIQIREISREVTETNCRRCHGEFTNPIERHSQSLQCTSCHKGPGH
jgi:cytochrome c nitrite reductase small subunit